MVRCICGQSKSHGKNLVPVVPRILVLKTSKFRPGISIKQVINFELPNSPFSPLHYNGPVANENKQVCSLQMLLCDCERLTKDTLK